MKSRYQLNPGYDHMKEDCTMYSHRKCAENDLQPCDFEDDDFKDCLRYKVKNLSTEFTQLR